MNDDQTGGTIPMPTQAELAQLPIRSALAVGVRAMQRAYPIVHYEQGDTRAAVSIRDLIIACRSIARDGGESNLYVLRGEVVRLRSDLDEESALVSEAVVHLADGAANLNRVRVLDAISTAWTAIQGYDPDGCFLRAMRRDIQNAAIRGRGRVSEMHVDLADWIDSLWLFGVPRGFAQLGLTGDEAPGV